MIADALPTWNEGKAKQSILDFVAKVTKPGGPASDHAKLLRVNGYSFQGRVLFRLRGPFPLAGNGLVIALDARQTLCLPNIMLPASETRVGNDKCRATRVECRRGIRFQVSGVCRVTRRN
jgi:hypothetical protein